MTKPERTKPETSADDAVPGGKFLVDEESVQVTFLLDGGMSTGATDRFRECVRGFGSSLIREVYRLEESERVPGEHTVEITSSMVVKADEAVRNSQHKAQRTVPTFALISPIAGTLSGLVAGIFGSYLNSWWQWALCVLFGVLAVVFLTLGTFELRRRS